MNLIEKFFLTNSIENLNNRFLSKKIDKSVPSYFNLNVANLGSTNNFIHRSNFEGNEIFSDNAVFSYRLRDKCIEEINNLFISKAPESKYFSLSISYGSSLISNLIAMSLRISYGKKLSIISSKNEHVGGIDPFINHGVIHKVELDIECILSETKKIKPDIIFLSHFSYEKGAAIDFKTLKKEISKLSIKPLLIIDCAQSLGCEDLPFESADIIFASSHKWLCGPRGLGLIWIKKDSEHKIYALGGDKGKNSSKLSIPGGYDFLAFFELLCSLRVYFINKNKALIKLKNYLEEQLSGIFQVIPSDHNSMLLLSHQKDLLPYYLDLLNSGVSVKFFKNQNYFRLSTPYFYTKDDIDKVVYLIKKSMNKEYV